MPLEEDDSDVIRQCLRAAVDGPFFSDSEFHTLFGFERTTLRRIAESWPVWDDPVEQSDAVSNSFNNLLGYPHGRWDVWHDYITPISSEVARVFARWRGETGLNPSGEGYFNRLR